MLKLVIIGLGGSLGALARYGLVHLVLRYANGSFPAGTFVVNLLGCFLIGGAMGLVEGRPFFSEETSLFLTTGFLGAFTTLSAVGYETFALLRAGELSLAVMNVGANVFFGVGAVALGWVGVKALGA
jgi:CrcB protein